jgi:ATP/ADP translocase
MKKSLFLYLFIIAALMNVFTYKYYSNKSFETEKNLKTKNKKLNDSLLIMYNNWSDASYFAFENNDRAQNYYEKYNTVELAEKVKQALLAFNDSPEGNKYVDQPKMGEQKFIINKIKLLNHRWIIADYSNGSLWGEVILKYFINEDGSITFVTTDSYLYPQNLN